MPYNNLSKYNVILLAAPPNLMVLAYNLKLKETPFNETHLLETLTVPRCPFRADLETIDKVKRQVDCIVTPF